MKAILEFNLPEDDEYYKMACSAKDMYIFIVEFQEYLRGQNKYGDPPDDIGKIYEYWFDVKGANDISS